MNEGKLESRINNTIKPDSPIDKGEYTHYIREGEDGRKYLTMISNEPIIVNYEKSPKLQELYKKAEGEASKLTGKINKNFILNAVYSVVDKAFEGGESNRVSSNKEEISLDDLIKDKVENPLYKTLTAAVLLEQFKKEEHIKGKISVEYKKLNGKDYFWVRYTNSKGRIFILDFNSEFKGVVPLETAVLKGREFYKRPEDNRYIKV